MTLIPPISLESSSGKLWPVHVVFGLSFATSATSKCLNLPHQWQFSWCPIVRENERICNDVDIHTYWTSRAERQINIIKVIPDGRSRSRIMPAFNVYLSSIKNYSKTFEKNIQIGFYQFVTTEYNVNFKQGCASISFKKKIITHSNSKNGENEFTSKVTMIYYFCLVRKISMPDHDDWISYMHRLRFIEIPCLVRQCTEYKKNDARLVTWIW
jgi:hypothetical protein